MENLNRSNDNLNRSNDNLLDINNEILIKVKCEKIYTIKYFINLYNYQNIVVNYLNKSNDKQGLLLNFDVGTGKTLTTISSYLKFLSKKERLYRINDENNVIILCPAALKEVWTKEYTNIVKKYYSDDGKECIDPTTISKIENIIGHQIKIESYNGNINKINIPNMYTNKFVVIDESHTFISRISNAANRSSALYSLLRKKDEQPNKMLMCTGTPIINTPLELAYLFNIVSLGDADIFNTHTFIDEYCNDNQINENMIPYFQNKIKGLVSYHCKNVNDKDYPMDNGINIQELTMSAYQSSLLEPEFDRELKNLRLAENKNLIVNDVKSSMLSSSRQLSNLVKRINIDDYDYTEDDKLCNEKNDINDTTDTTAITAITDTTATTATTATEANEIIKLNAKINENVDDDDTSIKYKYLYERLLDHKRKGEKTLVYSFFKNNGIIGLKNYLDRKEFTGGIIKCDSADSNEKILLINKFNHDNNSHGDKYIVFLGTSVIAEGITLSAVRHVYILEPYWNMSRIYQICGRVNRLKSHNQLSKSEKNFDVNILIAKTISGASVDSYIYNISLRKEKLYNEFLYAIRNVAISLPTTLYNIQYGNVDLFDFNYKKKTYSY